MNSQTGMPITLLILVPHEDPARINPATAWPKLYLIPRLRPRLKKIVVLSMGKRYGGSSRIKRLLRRLFPRPEYDGNVEYHYSPMVFVPFFEFLQIPLALFYTLVMLATRRIKVDAIYCITIGEPYFAPVALSLSSILRKPLIFQHCDPFWEELKGIKQRIYTFYQKLIMLSKYTKYSIAICFSVFDFLKKHFPNKAVLLLPGGYPPNFNVINVLDVDKIKSYYELEGKKIVFYAGTVFAPAIPITNLILAAKCVLERRKDVMFVIFGRNVEKLESFINSKIKDAPRYFLLGFKPHDEIKIWISLADVCLHIRKGSVSPTKVYEYMILKKPVIIATENPKRYDKIFLNGVNCVITSLNHHEIANNILHLLEDKEFSEKIRAEAFRTIKKYSWDYFSKMLLRMIETVVKR